MGLVASYHIIFEKFNFPISTRGGKKENIQVVPENIANVFQGFEEDLKKQEPERHPLDDSPDFLCSDDVKIIQSQIVQDSCRLLSKLDNKEKFAIRLCTKPMSPYDQRRVGRYLVDLELIALDKDNNHKVVADIYYDIKYDGLSFNGHNLSVNRLYHSHTLSTDIPMQWLTYWNAEGQGIERNAFHRIIFTLQSSFVGGVIGFVIGIVACFIVSLALGPIANPLLMVGIILAGSALIGALLPVICQISEGILQTCFGQDFYERPRDANVGDNFTINESNGQLSHFFKAVETPDGEVSYDQGIENNVGSPIGAKLKSSDLSVKI